MGQASMGRHDWQLTTGDDTLFSAIPVSYGEDPAGGQGKIISRREGRIANSVRCKKDRDIKRQDDPQQMDSWRQELTLSVSISVVPSESAG